MITELSELAPINCKCLLGKGTRRETYIALSLTPVGHILENFYVFSSEEKCRTCSVPALASGSLLSPPIGVLLAEQGGLYGSKSQPLSDPAQTLQDTANHRGKTTANAA